ncbi:sel1-repeat-containing protein ybeq [Anaeramoeba ignava]|uniref:Sel1-repeat-containing protein ybeq n=1 Tax=Anaeramoeba ignava TaxID=1746090 RepID=A0A9Q0LQ69_ANAIG|nr:sel1-repeat-containing protein ybeq [Anaeramoeba ignava]
MSLKNKFEKYLENANKGDLDSKLLLAKCYLLGIGTEKKEEKAFSLFEELSQQNQMESIYHLAKCYLKGIGTKKNEEKAFILFEKNQENLDSKLLLAKCYLLGIGTEKKEEKAFRLFEELSQQNQMESIYYLAKCYLKGIGTKKNEEKAFILFSKCENLSKSQYYLFKLNFGGIGIEKNEEKAKEWLIKSSENGYSKANFKLGSFLFEENQFEKAYELLAISYENGNRKAKEFLQRFEFTFGFGKITQLNENDFIWEFNTILQSEEIFDKLIEKYQIFPGICGYISTVAADLLSRELPYETTIEKMSEIIQKTRNEEMVEKVEQMIQKILEKRKSVSEEMKQDFKEYFVSAELTCEEIIDYTCKFSQNIIVIGWDFEEMKEIENLHSIFIAIFTPKFFQSVENKKFKSVAPDDWLKSRKKESKSRNDVFIVLLEGHFLVFKPLLIFDNEKQKPPKRVAILLNSYPGPYFNDPVMKEMFTLWFDGKFEKDKFINTGYL